MIIENPKRKGIDVLPDFTPLFGPAWLMSQPSQPKKEEEEKRETKEEFANRLARAFMDAINPERQRLSKRKRKRLRKAIYKIIINELERPTKDKDENIN